MTVLSAGFRRSMRAIAASTNSMGFTCLRCTRSACAVALRSASSSERDIDSFLCSLTIAAGIAHALAGAIIGRRLLDGTRTRTSLQAGLVGAGTSLLAVAFFSPAFVVFLYATDVHPSSALSYLVLTLLTSVFSFLGAGWALLLVSIGTGWGSIE